MKLQEIRISHYRSIKNEQSILFDGQTTLIGPNNSGKTNALRAISLLFSGYENMFKYDCEIDLPSDRLSKQTSIIGNFIVGEQEKWFWDKYDRLHEMHGTKRENCTVTLYLYFTSTNTPVYSFFTNTKRPNDKRAEYSRILRSLVTDFIEKFHVIYIPSEKSIVDLYSQLLSPRVSAKAAAILSGALKDLQRELEGIGASITKTLTSVGIKQSTVQLEVPDNNLENIVGEFSISVTDSVKTSYMHKGRGLQAAVFYASLHWIDERIKEEAKTPIWLIEEPESYMHPELAKHCRQMLAQLSANSMTTVSTHSMQFLPRDPIGIHGFSTRESATVIARFQKYDEACNSLKKSLGLRFSDYYSLGDNNVLFEGKTDVLIVRETLEHIKAITKKELPYISNATLIEKDGVTSLVGFLKAVYEHIRKEVAAVTVFDGDDAGIKARKELQGFFSKRGEFSPNFDFISVRSGFPIEGIFPDKWIVECHSSHPSWFKSWSVDASGTVEPFAIEDDKKENYAKYMCDLVLKEKNAQNIPILVNLLTAIDTALQEQHKRLHQDEDSGKLRTTDTQNHTAPPKPARRPVEIN